MVYIHGGASEFLSPIMMPVDTMVDNFASRGIVLVTVAYRLGILGFWSSGSHAAQGNWAMYDLIEALKWVQREGGKFGGNTDHVTLWGYSSASILISLLTLTNATRGLFHQSIPMSGGGYHDFILDNNVTVYGKVAENLGCGSPVIGGQNASHDDEILECMRSLPANTLLNVYDRLRDYHPENDDEPLKITWPKNDGPNGLFPRPIGELLHERRPVTTMLGSTRNEAGDSKLQLVNATQFTVAETCRSLISGSVGSAYFRFVHPEPIVDACIRRYVQNPDYGGVAPGYKFSFWTEQAVQLTEDCLFFAFTFKEAWTLTKAGADVYLYSFDYEKKGMEGISMIHGEDLNFLVDPLYPEVPNWDERDLKIKEKYISLVTNFVKHGNPTPPWPPTDKYYVKWPKFVTSLNYNKYFSIDLPCSVKVGFHTSGVTFWDVDVPRIENNFDNSGISDHQKSLWFVEEVVDTTYNHRNHYRTLISIQLFCLLIIFICLCVYVTVKICCYCFKRRDYIKL